MSRVSYKCLYIDKSLFRGINNNNNEKKIKFSKRILKEKFKLDNKNILSSFFLWKRNSYINKKFINKNVFLYNGLYFHWLKLYSNDFLNFRLGELTITRRSVKHSGKQKSKKKVKKIKK